MVDWTEAVLIVVKGFSAVFVIMGILATLTYVVGRIVTRLEKSKQESK